MVQEKSQQFIELIEHMKFHFSVENGRCLQTHECTCSVKKVYNSAKPQLELNSCCLNT